MSKFRTGSGGRGAVLGILVVLSACAAPPDGIRDVGGQYVGDRELTRIPREESRISVGQGTTRGATTVAYSLAGNIAERYREIAILPDGFVDYTQVHPPKGIVPEVIGSAEGVLPAVFADDPVVAERIASAPLRAMQARYGTIFYAVHQGDGETCVYFSSVFGRRESPRTIGNQAMVGERCRRTAEAAASEAFVAETLDLVSRLRFG